MTASHIHLGSLSYKKKTIYSMLRITPIIMHQNTVGNNEIDDALFFKKF